MLLKYIFSHLISKLGEFSLILINVFKKFNEIWNNLIVRINIFRTNLTLRTFQLSLEGSRLFFIITLAANRPFLLFGTIRYVDWLVVNHGNWLINHFSYHLRAFVDSFNPILPGSLDSDSNRSTGVGGCFILRDTPGPVDAFHYEGDSSQSSSEEFLGLPKSLRHSVSKGFYSPINSSLFWDKTYDVGLSSVKESLIKGSYRDPNCGSLSHNVNPDSQIFTPAASSTMAVDQSSFNSSDFGGKVLLSKSDPCIGHKLCFSRDPSARETGASLPNNNGKSVDFTGPCDKSTQTSLPILVEAETQISGSVTGVFENFGRRFNEDSPWFAGGAQLASTPYRGRHKRGDFGSLGIM